MYEMIGVAPMTKNCFIILELPFDPPENNLECINQRITEKSKFWASNFNDFTKGAEYKQNHQELPEIKKIMNDPALRAEEAKKACEITYGQLDRYITKVAKDETITEHQGKNIAEVTKLTLEIVKKRVTALGYVWKDMESYKAYYKQFYATAPDDSAKYEVISGYLKALAKKDYYDFIKDNAAEEIENLSNEQLLDRVLTIKTTRYQKNDSTSSSGKKICEACEVVFSSKENRASYDGYLYWKRIKSILDEVKDIARIDNQRISGDDFVYELEKVTNSMAVAKRMFIVFCTIENINFSLDNLSTEKQSTKQTNTNANTNSNTNTNRQAPKSPPPPPPAPAPMPEQQESTTYRYKKEKPIDIKKFKIAAVKACGSKVSRVPAWEDRIYSDTIDKTAYEYLYFEIEFNEQGVESTVACGYTIYTKNGTQVDSMIDRIHFAPNHCYVNLCLPILKLKNGEYYAEIYVGDSNTARINFFIKGMDPLAFETLCVFGGKSSKTIPSGNERVVTDTIDMKKTKAIFFEAKMNRAININTTLPCGFHVYDGLGTMVGNFEDNLTLDPEYDSITFTWTAISNLASGSYYVEVFLGNIKNISTNFNIINGKKGGNSSSDTSNESNKEGCGCLSIIVVIVILYFLAKMFF